MWTPSALASEFRVYARAVLRLVEGQHVVATNRLAATPADQALLEALADAAKPILPEAARGRHWLIAAPFRYGHAFGSRFRAAHERPGIFYAAEDIATACAEAAYWRLRALVAAGDPPPTRVTLTLIEVDIDTAHALDLTLPLFAVTEWTHPSDYAPTQALARAARQADCDAIRYPSARHREGICAAVLAPHAIRGDPRLAATVTFAGTDTELVASAAFPREFSARYRLSKGDVLESE